MEIELSEEAQELLIATGEEVEEFQDLIIATGEDGTSELQVNKPIAELTAAEQKQLADHIVKEIDDHPEGLPFLPLNLDKFTVWSFENVFLPSPEGPQPGIIITFAGPDDPRGTPYILNRERGLKFASQLKKALLTGPTVAQRAAQMGLSVPPSAGGGIILPGQ